MLPLIQFLVFYIIVPAIYIAVIAFDVLLISKASNLQNIWRGVGGAVAGFLIGVVVILLDLSFGRLIDETSNTAMNLEQVWPYSVIMAVIGFALLLIIDLLIERGIVPFIILFTVSGMFVSAYYLITLNQLRTLTAVGAIGFLIGTIVYFIFFPSRIFNHIRGLGE